MLYELSLKISNRLPRYSDVIPKAQIEPFTSISSGDENNQCVMKLFSHLGTHLDAPYHFCENGQSIDALKIDSFRFQKALRVDAHAERGGRIDRAQLASCSGIHEADLLLIDFGYCDFFEQEDCYRDDFPALTLDAARYIREDLSNVRAIAIDTLSVDGTDGAQTRYANHHVLLDFVSSVRPVLIYECVNMRPIRHIQGFFRVYGFPLRVVGADASPVTVVAETDEVEGRICLEK